MRVETKWGQRRGRSFLVEVSLSEIVGRDRELGLTKYEEPKHEQSHEQGTQSSAKSAVSLAEQRHPHKLVGRVLKVAESRSISTLNQQHGKN